MSRINLYNCTLICAIILTITNTILGQASSFLRKPWPTYSLQNMPQTRFTCHDKILGGYYADPETQCQMFHVCVKVAGVGVQDFRFLCPNATAFDQEAQICADWGDVDCESSVLYYGSDNFDLYRLGSGFESKRAPLAEEDESTFHLQRAESGDVRRFKETRVDQKSRPDQPPNYTKQYETVTSGTFNNNNYVNTQQHHIKTKKQKQTAEVTKKPIVSYYTPTSTTTTTTTTERNYNDDSKQDLDDIFKGSHSSHFFSNRNGGREDDLLDHPVKSSQKPNDFSDFSRKSESSTIGKSRVTPTRSKRPLQTSTPLDTTTTTTPNPQNVKKVTGHSSYNTDFYDFSQFKSTTTSSGTTKTTLRTFSQDKHNKNRYNAGNDYQSSAIPLSSTTVAPRARHSTLDQHNNNRFNFGNDYQTSPSPSTTQSSPRPSSQAQHNNNRYNFGNDYQTSAISSTTARSAAHQSLQNSNRFNFDNEYETQAKIQPTTYNPNRLKSTTVKFLEQKHDKSDLGNSNKPTAINKKLQKYEQTQQKYGPQNSTFVNVNEFNEFVKIKPQEPQPFQPQPPAKTFEAPVKSSVEPQYQRSRGHAQARANNNQHPEPFRAAQRATSQAQHNNNRNNFGNDYQSSISTSTTAKPIAAAVSDDTRPRGFVSRGRINYKATTQNDFETYPTSTANTHKKFSTLVPKDKYAPTTFKPSTYKKAYDNTYYQSQQTIRPSNKPQKPQTSAPSTTVYTTANPYYSPDEDDGQYHPELYETDFPRNKLNKNLQRSSSAPSPSTTTTTTTTQKPYKQNYQNPVNHLKTQQQTSFLKEQSADLADFSDEDELFKTAQSLNFGAASINKLRADIIKAEKTSQQYNSQYDPHNSITSPKTTTTTAKPSTSTTTYFTYPSYSTSTQTTKSPTTTFIQPFVSTTTTTTTRPTKTSAKTTTVSKTTTTPYPYNVTKSGKHADKLEKKLKKNENKKKTSKRPPHADEDTSYDYAYYDSDTLSETPQEYPEYEIQEFTRTRKN